MASILLQVPFFKHVFGWIGGHEAGTPGTPVYNMNSHFASAHIQVASKLPVMTCEMMQNHRTPIGESAVNTCLHRMT